MSEQGYRWLPHELRDPARAVERRLGYAPRVDGAARAWAQELGFRQDELSFDEVSERELLPWFTHSIYMFARADRIPGKAWLAMNEKAFDERISNPGREDEMLKWLVVAGLVVLGIALVLQKRRSSTGPTPRAPAPKPSPQTPPPSAPHCLVLAVGISDEASLTDVRSLAEAKQMDELARKMIRSYWYGDARRLPEDVRAAFDHEAAAPGEYDVVLMKFDLRDPVEKLGAPHATDRLDALECLGKHIERVRTSGRMNIGATRSLTTW